MSHRNKQKFDRTNLEYFLPFMILQTESIIYETIKYAQITGGKTLNYSLNCVYVEPQAVEKKTHKSRTFFRKLIEIILKTSRMCLNLFLICTYFQRVNLYKIQTGMVWWEIIRTNCGV